jgi:predicted CopG family antitoxin
MNIHGADRMEPDKNLHAAIPPALLSEAERVAQAEHLTVDELVREALERRLRERRRQNLRAYGEAQARKLGITTEEDVERVVHEFREEERARQQNTERGR